MNNNDENIFEFIMNILLSSLNQLFMVKMNNYFIIINYYLFIYFIIFINLIKH